MIEKRKPYREAHLKLIKEAYDSGSMTMAGAFEGAPSGSLLVFKGSEKVAAEFAKNDPYVKNGLILKWYVRPWNVVEF